MTNKNNKASQHSKLPSILKLIAVVLVTLFFGMQLSSLRFDHSVESFFPKGNPATDSFYKYRKQFGDDNAQILIGLRNSKGIFDSTFLNKVNTLTDSLNALPAIKGVISPTNAAEFRYSRMRPQVSFKYLHWDAPDRYEADSLRIFKSPLLENSIFSSKGNAVALVAQLHKNLDDKQSTLFKNDIDRLVAAHQFDESHVAGVAYTRPYYIHKIQNEVSLFIGACIFMMLLFLFIAYRSFWGVLLPIVIVLLSVLWTLGILSLSNQSINIITNIIPVILLVIGVAHAVHFQTNYLLNLRAGMNRQEALKQVIREVGLATVLTTFTTGIGFLSLNTSDFMPLVYMGWFSFAGIVVALILTFLVLPSAIDLGVTIIRRDKRHLYWRHLLAQLYKFSIRKEKLIMGIGALIAIISIIGTSQIQHDNYILDDLPRTDINHKAFTFFEQNFGGARPFILHLDLKDTTRSMLEPSILAEIQQVEDFLINEYGVQNVLSPALQLKMTNQILHDGRERYNKLPKDLEQAEYLFNRMNKLAEDNAPNFISEDKLHGRINGRISNWGGNRLRKLDSQFYSYIASEFPNSPIQYNITGSFTLLDLNNASLVENVVISLLVALGIIGVLFFVMLRSVKLTLLCLIPNLLPLLVVAGVMGFMGIRLTMPTSIIFIIAFGIVVDDSIHFLTRFLIEKRHNDLEDAIRKTVQTTGKAMLFTSLILVAGFSTLCLSSFLSTYYIGLFLSIVILVALLADMLLLPVLLHRLYKK